MATIDFYVYSLHSFISLQNLPRDALPDGSPVREKLANFKRPKKFKTSENDFSHGSFFLRIGGISKLEILYPIHIWNFHIGNISHAKLHLRSGGPLLYLFSFRTEFFPSRIQKSWNNFQVKWKFRENEEINISWDGVKQEVNWGIYLIKLSPRSWKPQVKAA